MSEAEFLLEIDYTPYSSACRSLCLTDKQELVLCRRQAGHDGDHATRRGANAIVWEPK